MANKQRAEVDRTSAAGTVYRFRLGTGALCQLEETLDLDVMQLFEKLQKGGIRLGMVREFVKAAAVDPPATTNEAAADLIDELGVMPVLDAMTDSILLTFNIPATPPAAGNGASPSPPGPPVDKKRARRATGAGISTAAPS